MLVYTMTAGLWITVSDLLIRPTDWVRYELVKGLAFVGLTSTLLWVLVSAHSRRLLAAESRARRAQGERLRALELLEALVDRTTDIVFAKDREGRFLMVNDTLARQFGLPREQLVGVCAATLLPKDAASALEAHDELVLLENRVLSFEEDVPTPEGLRRYLSTKGPIHDADGHVVGMFSVARDITQLADAHRSLRRANRALRLLTHATSEARDEAAHVDAFCARLVQEGGYRMAWIGRREADGRVTIAAQAGVTEGYLEALTWDDDQRPTGRAMRARTTVVTRDVEHASNDPEWRENALAHGFRSALALPIDLAGAPYGTLSIYADERDAFDAEEVDLLGELAARLASDILLVRERSLHEEAEARLARRKRRAELQLELPGLASTLSEAQFIARAKAILEEITGSRASCLYAVNVEHATLEVLDARSGARGESATGALAEAMQGRRPLVVEGPTTNPTGLASAAARERLLVVPVFGGNTPMIVCLADKARAYDEEDIESVQLVAQEISRFVERQRAEVRLRTITLAVEQSPANVLITNRDAELEYVNAAFTDTTGYRRDEVVGKNPRLLAAGAVDDEATRDLWQTLAAGGSWRGRFQNRRKDGTKYLVLATISPVRGPMGDVTHYVAWQEDITEKTQLGEELDHYRQHLAELVELRTAQLADARERAEAASRSKSAFLANMSHEIRTPLNAILGLTHLIRREGATPAQARRLEGIDVASRHLRSIVSDVLDLSKIEAGRLDLEHIPCSVAEVVEDVVALVAPQARDKGLFIEADVDPDAGWIIGDPTRLRQALANYMSNAVKFTERGGVTVKVAVSERSEREVQLRFQVDDTGVGVGETEHGRIFQAFEQADVSTTRRHGGTGLGLAITRRLVGLMGGDVGFESTVGEGSTFWFTIRATPAPSGTGRVRGISWAPQLRRRFTGRTVLLVEDNPVNQEVAVDLLRDIGLDVEVADDGVAAVRRGRERTYDLVLMDMQMPELDGLGATRILRTLVGWATVPIVAMTANAFAEDRAACVAAGMNDFLPKPVDPPQLYATLAEWLPESAIEPAASMADHAAGRDNEGQPIVEALRAIVGLDVDGALQRMGGRAPKLLRLLHGLLDDTAHPVGLRNAWASRDVAALRTVSHALKGAAANLGAVRLAAAASEVEREARAGRLADEQVESLLRLLDGLRGALPPLDEPSRPTAMTAIPDATVAPVLARLDALLAESDASAELLVEAEDALLRQALGSDFGPLRDAIARFDFDQARALIAGRGSP